MKLITDAQPKSIRMGTQKLEVRQTDKKVEIKLGHWKENRIPTLTFEKKELENCEKVSYRGAHYKS